MTRNLLAAFAAALGSAALATPVLALGVGTQNDFVVEEIDTGEDGIPDIFEIFADGFVDVGNSGDPDPLFFSHSFNGTFDFFTGEAIDGSFLILSDDEQTYLSGTLVGGSVDYFSPFFIIDEPGELVPLDTIESDVVLLFGFLVFDDLASDLIDVSLFEDESGMLVAEVFAPEEPIFFDDDGGFGLVPQNLIVAEFFGEAFIDYGDLDDGPPTSDVPLPAALPMLGLGLGLLGWTRSRRRKAA